jgi:hypothetical protein
MTPLRRRATKDESGASGARARRPRADERDDARDARDGVSECAAEIERC